MTRCSFALLLAVFVASCPAVTADDGRVVYEAKLNADIQTVWNAFTTRDGLQQWMASVIEVELAVGGKMKANYNPEGKIGDPTTIENTILSFDPKRMLSLKVTKFPKGFPFEDVGKAAWSVFYFSELPSSRTKVTVVGLGYTDDERSQEMRAFFAAANKYSLVKLNAVLKEQANTAPQPSN
jgi:uncharacterized protein YndB with AHSA1/START domain